MDNISNVWSGAETQPFWEDHSFWFGQYIVRKINNNIDIMYIIKFIEHM